MKKILILLILLLSATSAQAYNPANLPDEMLFSDAIEIFDSGDITGGSLSNIDDGLCVDLTLDECREFYNACSDLVLTRTVNPRPFSGVAINFLAGETVHTFYINSGVQLGLYGNNNYICYEFNGYHDEIMVMYSKYTESTQKYAKNDVTINSDRDFLKLPSAEWAKEIVKEAAEKSLLPYEFVNKFNTDITREDFCILLGNLIAVAKNYSSLDGYLSDRDMNYLTTYFTDCNDVDNSVNMLHALGIVNGKSENTFDPYASLTREEAAVLLSKTAKLLGNFPVSGFLNFTDSDSISDWAKDSVLWTSGYKIMSGITEKEFAPKGSYTVEQAVTTVVRLYNLI